MYQHSCKALEALRQTSVHQNPNWCQKVADRTRRARRHPTPPWPLPALHGGHDQSFVQSERSTQTHCQSFIQTMRTMVSRSHGGHIPTDVAKTKNSCTQKLHRHSCTTQSFPLCPTWEPVSPSNTSILLGPSTYSVWD